MKSYASLGQRAIAVIIDHVILFIVTAILAMPLGLAMVPFAMGGVNPYDMFAMMSAWSSFAVLSFLIWILYFTYFEGTTGQTLGKKALGIKVVKENGKKLDFVDAFIRNLLRLIDELPFVYIIGMVLIFVSQKKQRLGDLAASTLVMKA
ncbi:MAG: RDD family protein [Candidatus Aenigmarchaeota archaeon]|nr:RDD family protein [Candidatus Aenigmarchaeota archaeon]